MCKCTQAEKEKRIREVVKRLAFGEVRAEIVQYGSETWQITERQCDKYIRIATDRLAAIGDPDLETEKRRAVERAAVIMALAIDASQYRNALAANEQIIKLHGLYAPVKQEHSGEIVFAEMTAEERQERIDELIRKRGAGTAESAGGGTS